MSLEHYIENKVHENLAEFHLFGNESETLRSISHCPPNLASQARSQALPDSIAYHKALHSERAECLFSPVNHTPDKLSLSSLPSSLEPFETP